MTWVELWHITDLGVWLSEFGCRSLVVDFESTSEKGKSNPSWPTLVNEHTQGARWELQSLSTS